MSEIAFPADGSDHLDLLLATSEIGIWELDAASGKALRNLRHDQIFGHMTPLPDWSADIFLAYVVEEDRGRVRHALNRALAEGEPWSFETRIRRADGAERWISAKGIPKLTATGKVSKLIGHVIDITETKQNEDRLKLLSKELNHRVSNTFAILNSMVRHAKKKSTTVDDFAATLLERLGALARANRVLVAAEAERASLRDILEMEMKAFAGWGDRVRVDGNPNIMFSGEASEALAMILHELLTNAVKHGALSMHGGWVDLSIAHQDRGQVRICWAETGGPVVSPPSRVGIGSTILHNALRDQGTLTLDFAPDGLVCDILINHGQERALPEIAALETGIPQAEPSPVDDATCADLRIMVVEDDPIIGMDIAEILRARGAEVLGPFTTVAQAVQALRDAPDIVVLDVNLGHETADDVASQLSRTAIPFVVLSGHMDPGELDVVFQDAPIISKPFAEEDLVRHVIETARG